jgi:hypothetical protein
MGEDSEDQKRCEADATLEREIRSERKFTLAEAIGRLAGPGSMKGASPVTRKQQVESEIETWLRQHLADSQGALQTVLLQRIRGSETLLNAQDQPLAVLCGYCQKLVDSEYQLAELVREADIEWGRAFGERPHFDKPGAAAHPPLPPHPDDPYTLASVREQIRGIVQQLRGSA